MYVLAGTKLRLEFVYIVEILNPDSIGHISRQFGILEDLLIGDGSYCSFKNTVLLGHQ